MSTFEENLNALPDIRQLVLIRVLNAQGKLLALMPNLPGTQGALRIYNAITTTQGTLSFQEAKEGLRLFAEKVEDARVNPENHPNLSLLLALNSNEELRIQKVSCSTAQLLEKVAQRKASTEECDVFIELLNQGLVRSAEKIKGIWQPQTYVINGILNYFGTHTNQRLERHYWDKIPLKIANYTDDDFIQGGVRYAPGSIVRTGAYIGPQTVIMNLAFVNIGAYIAGEGVMIDGGSRVASCAQIGKNVKFGAGSGIEGILEPAGRLPSIVEDHVKIGAMCEISGLIEEGAVLASGVVMASGKKVYDSGTHELIPPYRCKVGEDTFLLPVIPSYRLAVGGTILSEAGKISTDAIILKPGDLRDKTTLKHFKQQGILYG
ncbi:DUF2322 family protein [Deltaproteobacteria bacterium TL4]